MHEDSSNFEIEIVYCMACAIMPRVRSLGGRGFGVKSGTVRVVRSLWCGSALWPGLQYMEPAEGRQFLPRLFGSFSNRISEARVRYLQVASPPAPPHIRNLHTHPNPSD